MPALEATYIERLKQWSIDDDDQAAIATAVTRLRAIRAMTSWVNDDAREHIATRATSQVPDLDENSIGLARSIAEMLGDAGTSANIDALARALADRDELDLFKSALDLTSSHSELLPAITKRMTAASWQEFRDLVEDHRSPLEAAGFNVASASSARWAAGNGAPYARLALEPGRDADADALGVSIGNVSDETKYVAIISAVLPVLEKLIARRAATLLVEDMAEAGPQPDRGIRSPASPPSSSDSSI